MDGGQRVYLVKVSNGLEDRVVADEETKILRQERHFSKSQLSRLFFFSILETVPSPSELVAQLIPAFIILQPRTQISPLYSGDQEWTRWPRQKVCDGHILNNSQIPSYKVSPPRDFCLDQKHFNLGGDKNLAVIKWWFWGKFSQNNCNLGSRLICWQFWAFWKSAETGCAISI